MNKKPKTLLIRIPEYPFPYQKTKVGPSLTPTINFLLPLGAISIATYAREKGGHCVEILDLNISIKKRIALSIHDNLLDIVKSELIKKISLFKPDIVGFSALFPNDDKWTFYCAEIVKSCNSEITTLVGGGLATVETKKVLLNNHIDYAVLGEGEIVFNNFLNSWPDKKLLSEIKGLAFKEDNKIVINEREKLIKDLDSIPIPNIDLVPTKYYDTDLFHLFSSRGCPFNCKFCVSFKIWGKKNRRHSVNRVISEIKILRDKYGINRFDFRDDNFTLDSVWLKEFCRGMILENEKSKAPMKWGCPNGLMIKTLDIECVKLMHKAGCEEFVIAIESGSERVAKDIIGKSIDYQKARLIRNTVKELGAAFRSFFMIGLPGETKKEIKQTIKFLITLDSDWSHISIFQPFPGTELYDLAKELGAISNNTSGTYLSASLSTKDFSSDEIKQIQYDTNIKYNFLRNRNLIRKDKKTNLQFYMNQLEKLIESINNHVIAKIALGYLYYLDENKDKTKYWWEQALQDLKDPVVQEDFNKYLEWKKEEPIKRWREFVGWDQVR